MTEKEKQFVPYELAVKLKELGFDEPCIAGYRDYNGIKLMTRLPDSTFPTVDSLGYGKYCKQNEHVVKAPLWQQAFDWIRKEYNITFWIQPCGGWFKKAYLWEYCIVTHDNRFIGHRSEYHEEQEALLRRLIRIIEEGEYDK